MPSHVASNGDAPPDVHPARIVGMAKAYYRTAGAAQYLDIGQSTLERMRVAGTGPTWRRLGSKIVVYAVSDLDAWASQHVLNSTSQAA
jgi:predicted DNA-binding transcriptional regulator AlpA